MIKNRVYIITECPYVGVFRAIVELSRELKKIGIEINYILPSNLRNRYGERQKDHENVLLKYGNIIHKPLRRKYRYILGDIICFKKFFKLNNDATVISYTEYAGKICRILYRHGYIKRLFHVPSCIGIKRKKCFSGFIEYIFEKILAKDASAYLACGSSEAFILKDKYKIPIEKIIFLPNLRTVKKISSKKIKYEFIYVGRMVKDKGVYVLLDAFRLLGILNKIVLVGDGKELNALKSIYPEANFTGRISPEKVFNYLSVSKFFISNSITEGLPYSLIEAMAFGVVPIVSNVEGHKDLIIDGRNGFLYNKQIDLVNSLFKAQLISTKDYNGMRLSSQETITNLSKMAKENINKNFKYYD
jgi:glycosyltransferase involved in cell wall biosynthesis